MSFAIRRVQQSLAGMAFNARLIAPVVACHPRPLWGLSPVSGVSVPARASFLERRMSLPKPDLHLRLSPEAKATLHLLAEVEGAPESTLAGQYLEEPLLGKGHVLKIAARQLSRMGFDGMERD